MFKYLYIYIYTNPIEKATIKKRQANKDNDDCVGLSVYKSAQATETPLFPNVLGVYIFRDIYIHVRSIASV